MGKMINDRVKPEVDNRRSYGEMSKTQKESSVFITKLLC